MKYKYTGVTIGDECEKELEYLSIRLVQDAEYELVSLTENGENGYFRDEDNHVKLVPMDVMEAVI